MIILRTHPDFIEKVSKRSMHALASRPNITKGELVLISQTIAQTDDGLPPIRYVMVFDRIIADRFGEISRSIWGRSWRYVVYGKDCHKLAHPFSMKDIQVSSHNYGQGGPYVYVAPDDEAVVHRLGLLA